MTYFSGRVVGVIFAQEETSFYILRMALDGDKKKTTTVRGNVVGLNVHKGVWFGFEGRWDKHPQYGLQLVLTRAPVMQGEWTGESAFSAMVADGISSIVLAQISRQHGPQNFLDVLSSKEKLHETYTPILADDIHARWCALKDQFKSIDFLQSLNLPKYTLKSVWATFGEDTHKVLSEDPWSLVRVKGVTFARADEAARKLGVVDERKRLEGAIYSASQEGSGFGHLYLTMDDLFGYTHKLLNSDFDEQCFTDILLTYHRSGDLVLDAKTVPNEIVVYSPWCYTLEDESARLLIERASQASLQGSSLKTYLKSLGQVGPLTKKAVKTSDLIEVAATAISEWGTQAKIDLSDQQKQGVLNALTQPISILTGLPGTGKTTSLQAVVHILQDAGVPFLLCAPTGIAAKNLTTRTGALAGTIHRSFGAQFKDGGTSHDKARSYVGVTESQAADMGSEDILGPWKYREDNPYPVDVVVVDEASMLDQHLMYRLMVCTGPKTRFVFVGDGAQLPSVGPGNVLKDLSSSDLFPSTHLDQVYRQEEAGGIVLAAHAIYEGRVPDDHEDFNFIEVGGDLEAKSIIEELSSHMYARRKNFQVLSPKHKGDVGVTALNESLRRLLNPASPGKSEFKVGRWTVREGDRVMITRNDYDLGVFNGDVGKIHRVDRQAKEVQVKIFGTPPRLVTLKFSFVSRMMSLAYATTVHKSQGLEYDYIILPVVRGFYHQLQRNLYYTGITRARKGVILVGQRGAFERAILNDTEDDRKTLFDKRLQAYSNDVT